MRMLISAAFACVIAGSVVAAQENNPVARALRADAERYERDIVGAAQEMPSAKFSTKATPAQMSFAELSRHVAMSNDAICAAISGQTPPKVGQLSANAGKETLVGALKDSFAFCRSALNDVDDSRLGEEVTLFRGRKATRAAAMLDLAADWGDHYSQMATDLRVAGLLPPTAQRASKGE